MSDDDLLTKEKEFYRLNQELQLKTRDVMKEVNSILHASVSNNLINDTNQLYSSLTMKNARMTHQEDIISKINKESRELSSDKVSEIPLVKDISNIDISPKRDNCLGNKAIVNLFKSKIDMLYKELRTMQLEYNKKCEYSKELEVENKKLDEIQVKLRNQIGSLNDTVTKLECTNSDALSRYQALNNENIALRKDLDSLKKEIKILSQQSTNYDVRLNRSLESNEKLRNALKCSEAEEKEMRNQIRKLQEDKRLTTKNLEKQRSELVQAFKKQMLLIDNLKRQNMLLMASGQIHLMEEDFAKLLEWKAQQC